MATTTPTNLSQLPPPPAGQTGISPTALKGLPPPPAGQTGMTLDQVQNQQTQAPAPASSIGSKIANFLGGNIASQFKSGLAQTKQAVTDITSGHDNGVQGGEAGLSGLSGIASMITSPLAPLFKPVKAGINAVVNGYEGANGDHVGGIADIPAVQKFAQTDASKAAERPLTDIANAGNVAGTIDGLDKAVGIAPAVGDTAATAAKAVGNKAVDIATKPSFVDRIVNGEASLTDDQAAPGILKNYNTAVKPTIAGKTGTGQFENYNANVVSAVKTIAQNKDGLELSDEDGGKVTGQLPTNRAQFADAVEQTKSAIFQKYNSLATAAGEKGVAINLSPAHDALGDVINNEALKISNPAAVEYAKGIQDRLVDANGEPKNITPEVAQEVIKGYNSSLSAFYKNPTYESASRAAIDAGVVAEIRKSLDDAITNASPEASNARSAENEPGYQALKKQYGALSAIEKDVNKSAIMQAKQSGGATTGLGKYVDVFSGGDMASGLLSLNPALFAKGLAQTGISHYFQWLNSPDRAVSSMFDTASKAAK